MIDHTRRRVVLAAASASLTAISSAFAANYPAKPIKFIIPTSAGTSADANGRFFADMLSARLNTPVVVENRSGAGGLIAYTALAKSASDGYTIMMAGLPLHLLPHFSDVQNPFDPINDFTPIARISRAPLAIVVNASSRYRSLGDLLQALKTASPELTYSTGGYGSAAHMCAVMVNKTNNTAAKHVPYKDTSAAVIDVAGDHVAFTCQGSGSVLPLIQAGKLRALAVTGLERWEALPDVPTAAQAGLTDFELWPGLDVLGPAGLPQDVVKTLSETLMQIGRTPEYVAFCRKQGLSHALMDHSSLKDQLAKEVASWKQIAAVARRS